MADMAVEVTHRSVRHESLVWLPALPATPATGDHPHLPVWVPATVPQLVSEPVGGTGKGKAYRAGRRLQGMFQEPTRNGVEPLVRIERQHPGLGGKL